MQSTQHEQVPISDDSPIAKESCRAPAKYLTRRAQVVQTQKKKQSPCPQATKKRSEDSNTVEPVEICRARELNDAKIE
jgi:hypothetical protein